MSNISPSDIEEAIGHIIGSRQQDIMSLQPVIVQELRRMGVATDSTELLIDGDRVTIPTRLGNFTFRIAEDDGVEFIDERALADAKMAPGLGEA